MPHKHQLQSDGPDQLSSSCSPAGKQCFFVEKPYKKLIRKNNLLNSKKVAFKTILQRLHRCWKVTSSVGWEDDLGEGQWLELRSTFPSALNERDVFAGPFRCRWNGTRLFASVSLVGGQPMLQQYLRSKVVGWNNALSHTAETNGPWFYTASFTKKSRWVKVQKFRFCVTGSGQLPSNLQIVFFGFHEKVDGFLSLDFAAKMSAVTHHRRGIVAVLHFSPWLLFGLAQAWGAKETDLVMSCLVFILHPFLGPQSFWTIIMSSYLPRHVFFFGSRSPHCRGHTTW